ncbi:leucine-rich repeat domain-containing protein [Treponema sp.]|uniref:leucine-rich repeat domain-containing protein n=1 Tax=Treponema sp. TaxID=166 RepID=UPI00298DBC53|nr:leucine-rich repeat protein [Treponema sp.]
MKKFFNVIAVVCAFLIAGFVSCKAPSSGGGNGGGAQPGEEYSVFLEPLYGIGGTISCYGMVNGYHAISGTEMTPCAEPAGGYEVTAWNITTAEGDPVQVTNGKFIMPASDITIAAICTFVKKPTVNELDDVLMRIHRDETVVLSGEVKSSDLVTIADAIKRNSVKINLDLSEVTGLTSIPQSSFAGCTNLTGITIPDTVTSIASNAFSSCSNLTSITFEDTSCWRGETTNSGNSVLKDFTNPAENVTYFTDTYKEYNWEKIGAMATVGNIAEVIAGLTEDLTIVMSGEVKPSDIATIRTAISKAKYKIDLDLSNVTGLTEIPEYGFVCGEKLCGITLPDTVTAIGNYAFCCTAFTEIKIPSSVKTIGNSAFEESLNLTKINVDSNNKNYCDVDGVLFNKDKTELVIFPCGKSGLYTIPDFVKTIGSGAFTLCKNLTEITISDSVKTIEENAFGFCSNLEKVAIGKSVETIEVAAFRCCKKLTEITIPDSVKTIGSNAFSYCQNLEKVTMGKSIETIGECSFSNCYKLTEIIIPDSVEWLGNDVFFDCKTLASVTFEDPSGWYVVKSKDAWENKTGGTSVDFSDPVANVSTLKSADSSSLFFKLTSE